MRTENSTTPATAVVARIGAQLARVRRSVWARGPAVRWLAALTVLGVLAALGYVAAGPSPGKYLGQGRQYSADDLAKITHALEAQRIEYRLDDRRVSVSTSRHDEATEAIAKLEIGPRTIADIRKLARDSSSSLWTIPSEKERRNLEAKEEIAESMIGELDGVVSAYVQINRTQATVGLRPTSTATAFVWLETRDGRELPAKIVQNIKEIVVHTTGPALKPDAVTVKDRKGHLYLDAANPELNEISRIRVREEELEQEILQHVEWIKGVRVTVHLGPAPVSAPAVAPVPAAPAPEPAAEPRVGVNQPLDLTPEPEPVAAAPAPEPAAEKPAPPESTHAHVWVKVPRSFYFKALPSRDPSMDDLQEIRAMTEEKVRRAANYVLHPRHTFEVMIDMIPDLIAQRDTLVAPAVPESRGTPSWWVPAAVGGATAAALLALGIRLLASRRPRGEPVVEAAQGRFTRDVASEPGPGPSERVRELIRRNPEAAASVLHRWIGQGGHAA